MSKRTLTNREISVNIAKFMSDTFKLEYNSMLKAATYNALTANDDKVFNILLQNDYSQEDISCIQSQFISEYSNIFKSIQALRNFKNAFTEDRIVDLFTLAQTSENYRVSYLIDQDQIRHILLLNINNNEITDIKGMTDINHLITEVSKQLDIIALTRNIKTRYSILVRYTKKSAVDMFKETKSRKHLFFNKLEMLAILTVFSYMFTGDLSDIRNSDEEVDYLQNQVLGLLVEGDDINNIIKNNKILDKVNNKSKSSNSKKSSTNKYEYESVPVNSDGYGYM